MFVEPRWLDIVYSGTGYDYTLFAETRVFIQAVAYASAAVHSSIRTG